MSPRRAKGERPISDYGLIGNCHSAALVALDGSIDWCCLPRFDSAAVFSRILDAAKGGYFQISPLGVRSIERRYISGTNVLETTFQADTGVAVLTDFMPTHADCQPGEPIDAGPTQQVARILKCIGRDIHFKVECHPGFDYGTIVPHASVDGPHTGYAHGGADGLTVYCSAPVENAEDGFESEGLLREGQKVYAAVTYQSRFSHAAEPLDDRTIELQLADTARFWQEWSALCT